MAIVSLNAIGAAMSKAGSVTLAGITENAYTRTHPPYDRVNPFQVENGYAPSEWVAPHSLNDWHGYHHPTVNSGTVLEVGGAYGGVTAIWALPAGYARDSGSLAQRIYYKSMGTSQDLSVNPFAAGSSNNVLTATATTYSITGLDVGDHYAVGVKVEWNDSVNIYTNVDSLGYNTKGGETPLIGGGRGVATGEVYATNPTMSSVTQVTDPETCSAFSTGNIQIRVSVVMNGPSQGKLQERIDGGSWGSDIPVGAGGSTLLQNARDPGHQYDYRIRYNDISPDTWSTIKGVYTVCSAA